MEKSHHVFNRFYNSLFKPILDPNQSVKKKEFSIRELLENVNDPDNANLLGKIRLEKPLDVYVETLNIIKESESLNDEKKLATYAAVLSGILDDKVSPTVEVNWSDPDTKKVEDKEYLKNELYRFIVTTKITNTNILKNIGVAYAKIVVVEYSAKCWNQDFDRILSMLSDSENYSEDFNKFGQHYCFLCVLSHLLQHEIPDPSDPSYDMKVNQILDMLNFRMMNNEYDDQFETLIFECIESAIRIFKKHFNSVRICSIQIDNLLQIIRLGNENFVQPCYRCLNLIVKLYYDNIYSKINDIFNLTIINLQYTEEIEDNKQEIFSQCSLEFWRKVAKIESKLDLRKSQEYTLGVIPHIVEKYLLYFITLTDPEDFDPDSKNDDSLYFFAKKCLKQFAQKEPDLMYKYLSKFFLDHIHDIKANNRGAALIAFYCLIECEKEDFISDNFEIIFNFAQNINERLKYHAIKILCAIAKKCSSVIESEERIQQLIKLVLLNIDSNPQISSKCFEILNQILVTINYCNNPLKIKFLSNFDDIYNLIDKGVKLDNKKAIICLKKLIEISPRNYDEKILNILSTILDEIQQNQKQYSQIIANYITVIPDITKRINGQTNAMIPNTTKVIINLILENSHEYHELLATSLAILPYIPNQTSFTEFGKPLLEKIFQEYLDSDQRTILLLSNKIIVKLYEMYPGDFLYDSYKLLDETFNLLFKELNSDSIMDIVYPSILKTLSLLTTISCQNSIDITKYRDKLISTIDLFMNIKCDFDLQQKLLKSLLKLLLSLFETFYNDQEFIMNHEKKAIMFIKQIERLNLCQNEFLEASVNIIFIIAIVLGAKSFVDLRQASIQQILTKGSCYNHNPAIASSSIRILNIINNY